MQTLVAAEAAFLAMVDTDWSYRLAKSLEQYRTNPVLGYRTAGSQAEFETGELLLREMGAIGLQNLRKDRFTLDSWSFSHARLSFTQDGVAHRFELGAYQTHLDTEGERTYTILDAGRGTAAELDALDVRGKLVLVDINQREDWWISYPVYQACRHGAAAVIAVQKNGYGEIDSTALNAQNICSTADAPAFSLSRADAKLLRRYLAAQGGEAEITFDAKSIVQMNGESFNIVGEIPGRDPEAMILVTAHYDSYFSGFQDDNAAVALMMGIARAMVKSGYEPEKTLVFCALAAEEWGVSNSKYDWSTGAYNQIFRVHPEWVGKTIVDINFELPAYAHDTRDVIRSVWEYQSFLQQFIKRLPDAAHLFPDGIAVKCPVLTWSDDFSMAIAGVPSLVNDFAKGSFMESHYHSQFDNADAYDPQIYDFHHRMYGRLLLAYDRSVVAPLDFLPRLSALQEDIDPTAWERAGVDATPLRAALGAAHTAAELCHQKVRSLCHHYADALERSDRALADQIADEARPFGRGLLAAFLHCEDTLLRLGWQDEVIFPHGYAQRNLALLEGVYGALQAGEIDRALEWLGEIDVNCYARSFDRETCRHFIDYVFNQPAERLMWGAGRLMGLCDLSETVRALSDKRAQPAPDLSAELAAVAEQQLAMQTLLMQAVADETTACERLAELLTNFLQA